MNLSEYRKGLHPGGVMLYMQFFLVGILFGETWAISRLIGAALNTHISLKNLESTALVLSTASLIVALAYIFIRDAHLGAKKLFKSNRVDLLLIFVAGLILSLTSSGIGTYYYAKVIEKLSPLQLATLTILPILIQAIAISKTALLTKRNKKSRSFFLNDHGIDNAQDDLLNLSSRAKNFANQVINGGAPDSLVFGIDAPWGTGKTSFINLCCEEWKKATDSKIIVHRFEPLRYEEGSDLTQKFIDDLINTIQQEIFAPELRSLFKQYESLIKSVTEVSIADIKFSLLKSNETIESTLEKIEVLLQNIDARIIVIVDDLDRLHWSSIKNILFSIKRSFMLPNISYILCYDTENIKDSNNDIDSEKAQNFLEKFINIKSNIFIDSTDLKRYISTNFETVTKKDIDLSPLAFDRLKGTIEELGDIFDSVHFYNYLPFVGNIRKIKRLINTLMLLDIDKTDFHNSDFNKSDLLHLIMIYLYHPQIFRAIYSTETNGKTGIFGIVHSEKPSNSEEYRNFIKSLTSEEQRFLLSRVFDPEQLTIKTGTARTKELNYSSRACYQGNTRNLENHLNLIVKLSAPTPYKTKKFYLNQKDLFLNYSTIKDFLLKSDYCEPGKTEISLRLFWNTVVNHIHEFTMAQATQIIEHLIETLPHQSLVHNESTSGEEGTLCALRQKSIFSIVKILDSSIRTSEEKRENNITPQNISAIAKWIFEGNENHDSGIIDTLTTHEKGVLGFYDLMMFRLNCKADRNPKLIALWQSISYHNNENPPLSSNVYDTAIVQMREMTQRTFKIFKSHFIDSGKNVFSEINNTPNGAFVGSYENIVIPEKPENGNLHQKILIEKSSIKSFLTYQLFSKVVGDCGMYDETGENDKQGISKTFTNYLFSFCFNPDLNPDNYGIFLDFLLSSLDRSYNSNGETEYTPNFYNFTRSLDENELKKYWIKNSQQIKKYSEQHADRIIYTTYYSANYQEDLPFVYKALDDTYKNKSEPN